jgi:hypothetical protein
VSLLPGIRLPKIGFLDWLFNRKETVYLYFTPYTEEQKAELKARMDKCEHDRKNGGLAHEERSAPFIQGRYLFEVIPCTMYGKHNGDYTYFIYDCRDTELTSDDGDFLDCNTLSSYDKAVDAGYKHIEWLLSLEK